MIWLGVASAGEEVAGFEFRCPTDVFVRIQNLSPASPSLHFSAQKQLMSYIAVVEGRSTGYAYLSSNSPYQAVKTSEQKTRRASALEAEIAETEVIASYNLNNRERNEPDKVLIYSFVDLEFPAASSEGNAENAESTLHFPTRSRVTSPT